MVIPRSHRPLVATFATLATALAVAFALAQSEPSVAGAGSVDAQDLREGFAVFSRPTRAGDALPDAVRGMFAAAAAEKGLDLGAARAVAPAGKGYVWLLAGPKSACLASPTRSTATE